MKERPMLWWILGIMFAFVIGIYLGRFLEAYQLPITPRTITADRPLTGISTTAPPNPGVTLTIDCSKAIEMCLRQAEP